MGRVLGARRLSHDTDASTSIRDDLGPWLTDRADEHGKTIASWTDEDSPNPRDSAQRGSS